MNHTLRLILLISDFRLGALFKCAMREAEKRCQSDKVKSVGGGGGQEAANDADDGSDMEGEKDALQLWKSTADETSAPLQMQKEGTKRRGLYLLHPIDGFIFLHDTFSGQLLLSSVPPPVRVPFCALYWATIAWPQRVFTHPSLVCTCRDCVGPEEDCEEQQDYGLLLLLRPEKRRNDSDPLRG